MLSRAHEGIAGASASSPHVGRAGVFKRPIGQRRHDASREDKHGHERCAGLSDVNMLAALSGLCHGKALAGGAPAHLHVVVVVVDAHVVRAGRLVGEQHVVVIQPRSEAHHVLLAHTMSHEHTSRKEKKNGKESHGDATWSFCQDDKRQPMHVMRPRSSVTATTSRAAPLDRSTRFRNRYPPARLGSHVVSMLAAGLSTTAYAARNTVLQV